MERVQLRSINDSRLPSNEHLLAILEVINDNSSRVAEPDLEDGVFVLPPPFLVGRQHESGRRLLGHMLCAPRKP